MLITSAVWMYGMLDTNVFYECLMSLPGKEPWAWPWSQDKENVNEEMWKEAEGSDGFLKVIKSCNTHSLGILPSSAWQKVTESGF